MDNIASKPSKDTMDTEDPDARYSPVFKCEHCDYTNISERGLAQHFRMRHRISQVDGMDDIETEVDIEYSENKRKTTAHEKESQTDVFLKVDEKNYSTGPSLEL